jgi:hypothetical protein
MPWRPPARRKLTASRVERAQVYALFDQLFPRQRELHADLELAVLDRVTESVDRRSVRLRVGQWCIDVPLWTPP